MVTLAELHAAVAKVIAGGSLGKVVFVRYHLQGILGGRPPALAAVAAAVGDWIGQPPATLYNLSSGTGGPAQSSLTLRFPDGGTALLSEAHGPAGGKGVSLMVLGSKGGLYHDYEAGTLHTWADTTAPPAEPRAAGILTAIEAAQKGTNPAAVRKVSRPAPLPPPKPPGRKPKYGVLLVTGSHTHQENYAAALAADGRCKVVAVSDEKDIDRRRRLLNERMAREYGVPYEPDLAKALARKDVQIVSVCAEPERRGRIIVQCAEAGKHLYLDKSLAPALADAEAIVAAVRKAKVKSHMFSFVMTPWAAEAKRLIDSGKLGKLLAVHADAFFAKGRQGTAKLGSPRKEEYPPRRHQLIEAKRELDNVGVYPVTLIPWLTGKKFRTVYGLTGNYFFKEHQKHDVEDFGLLACTLEDGPPWTPPNVNPDDPMGFWTSTQAAVHLRPKPAWQPFGPPARSDASYFLDRLDEGKESVMSVVEAAHAAEVLLAGYLSASKGEVVKLPLPR